MKTNPAYTDGINFLVEAAGKLAGAGPAPVARPLFGDGSDRKFFRIFCRSRTFVALVSPRTRFDSIDENDSYLKIGRHLHSKGVPVPRILLADAADGRFLLEDAGDLHLQSFAMQRPASLEKIYRRVLLMLAALHRKAREGFDPGFCFDTPIYDAPFIFERELEYFRQRFLNGFLGLEIGPEKLKPDFENLAGEAGARRMDFVFHRDFQSRNIMVCKNRLWLLDFQGMRFGPPAYDLASLLIDPYVRIPEALQDRLADLYLSAAGRFPGCSHAEFLRNYTAVRLCRNLQVLGAFGFLGMVKGKRQFLDYVPAAWAQLRHWLAGARRGRFPELERTVALADAAMRRKKP